MDTYLIEDLRKRKKLTQAQFAELIDFTVTGYQKMIANKDIKISSLEKICEVFDVNMLTFFGIYDTKKVNNANVHFELESDDVLKIDLKNKRLEILKK